MPLNFLNTGYFADKVGIGTNSPNKTLELGYSNIEQNVLQNGLAGGGAGTGILVFNTDTTTNEPFANIDFRAGNADGRIAIQRAASNSSNFHFITDNNNTFSTKMFLKHNGQFGLGTVAPVKNIELSYSNTETDVLDNLAGAGTGGGVLLRNIAGTGYANIDFRVNDADGRIAYKWEASNTGNFHFITDNAGTVDTKMFIKHGGEVGIGTTSPNYALDIKKDISSLLNLHRPNSSTAAASFLDFSFNTANATEAVYARIRSDVEVNTNSAQGGDLSFHTANAGTVGEVMRLTQEGNVGIGTIGPLVKLHVETTDSSTARFAYNGSNYQDLNWEGSNIVGGSHVFKIGGAEKMRIGSSGNVGINTTSPLGRLQINEYTVALQGNQNVHGELSVFASSGAESLFLGIKNAAYPNRGWAFNPVTSGVNSDLQIKEHGASGVRMTIKSGGNVGINDTSPDFKLDVGGTIGVSDLPFNTTSVSALVANETIGAELLPQPLDLSTDFTANTAATTINDSDTFTVSSGGTFNGITLNTSTLTFVVGAVYKLILKGTTTASGSFTFGSGGAGGNEYGSGFGNFEFTAIHNQLWIRQISAGETSFTEFSVQLVTSASDQIQKRQLGTGAFGPTPVGAYLPLAGGTMTGNTLHGDSVMSRYGTGNDFSIYHNGTDGYLQNEVGNLLIPVNKVGIGTSSPLGKLHVYNTATTSNGDGTASETATGQDSITLYGHGGTNGQTYGSITWMGGSRRRAMISAVAENADTDYIGLAFYTQGTDGSGNYSESMRISRSGKVGIGTTSPGAKLEIVDTSNPNASSGSVIIEGRRDGSANLLTLRAKDASAPSSALPNGQGSVIRFQGFDGTDFENMAFIQVAAHGQAVANGDAPSFMAFGTSADASSSPAERMRIDSDGNVGIGVTGPVGPLDVFGDAVQNGSAPGIRLSSSNTQQTVFAIGNTGTRQYELAVGGTSSSVPGAFYIYDNNVADFRITLATSGNFGIGNTTPTYKLVIGGNGGLGDSIKIGTYEVAKDTRQYIGYARFDTGVFETATGGNTPSTVLPGVSGIRIVNTAGTVTSAKADQSIQLLTHIYNGNSRVALHADANGSIGIGTTSPGSKLQVSGSGNESVEIKVSGGTTAGNTGSISLSRTDGAGSIIQGAAFLSGGVPIGGIAGGIVGSSNTSAPAFAIQTPNSTNGHIVFNPKGAEKMRITSGGNVGVGTTSPQSQLQVAGGIQMADDTATASADKVGTMRYRTGTEYVEDTGKELITDGNFSSSTYWLGTNVVVASGVATFTGTSGQESTLSQQNITIVTTSGTLHALTYTVVSNSLQGSAALYAGFKTTNECIQKQFLPMTVGTHTVYANSVGTGNGFSLHTSVGFTSGTLVIDNVSVYAVTEEDASYADMCMQTGASAYEWVNIVRNTY